MLRTGRNNWLGRIRSLTRMNHPKRRSIRHDYPQQNSENLEQRVVLSAIGPMATTADPMVSPVDPHNTPIYVDAAAAAGGDGSSWARAFDSLQDGLALADVQAGADDVYVMAGTYTPGNARSQAFDLPDDVRVFGGFEDASQSNPHQRTGSAAVTVLSGDLAGDDGTAFGSRAENAFHVVTALDGDGILLDRFTVTAGNANGSSTANWNIGAGVYVDDTDGLRLNDLIVRSNSAELAGGGVAVIDSTDIRIDGSKIGRNTASAGGGVLVADSRVSVSDSKISGNKAGGGAGIDAYNSAVVLAGVGVANNVSTVDGGPLTGRGGGVRITNGDLKIRGGSFESNGARIFGGGIYATGSNVKADGTTFVDNVAGSGGGAVALDGSTFVGSWLTVGGNSAALGAGGIGGLNSNVTLTDSVFRSNSTDGIGGAIAVVGSVDGTLSSELHSAGNTYTGNHAGDAGGAIYGLNSNLTSRGDTFINNTAGNNGGAIAVEERSFPDAPGPMPIDPVPLPMPIDPTLVTPLSVDPTLVDATTVLGRAIAIPLPPDPHPVRYVTQISGSHFDGNRAAGRDATNILSGLGGAVWAGTDLGEDSHLSVRVNGSSFGGNAARNGGAIALGNVAAASVTDSGFHDNHARYDVTAADATGFAGNGGAVLAGITRLKIGDSEFVGNVAGNSGGAVYTILADMKIDSSRLHDNSARNDGGAMYLDDWSHVSVTDSGMSENRAGDDGGAVYSLRGTLDVSGSKLAGNTANSGGAIFVNDSHHATFSDTDFARNRAVAVTDAAGNVAGGRGGAIRVVSTPTAIRGGDFVGNTATIWGGAVDTTTSRTSAAGTHFESNHARSAAGAVAVDGGAFTGEQLVFAGNTAGIAAGALGALDADVSVSDSLFRGNSARDLSGGAVAIVGSSNGTDSNFRSGGNTYTGNKAGGDGGGVYVLNTNMKSRGDRFSDNVTAGNGGAIRIDQITITPDITPLPIDPTLVETDVTLDLTDPVPYTGGINEIDPIPLPIPPEPVRYTAEIAGSHFRNNTANLRDDGLVLTGNGGAIYAGTLLGQDSTLAVSISGSEFSRNAANNGGAVAIANVARSSISHSSFSENRAVAHQPSHVATIFNGDGGAVIAALTNLGVSGSRFHGNTAGHNGGALYVVAANVRVNQSGFGDNSARNDGGAVFVNQGSDVGVNFSTFDRNEAGRRGGSVAVQDAKLNVQGGTMSDGNAARGGAISADHARVKLEAATIQANHAANGGGGISATNGTSLTVNRSYLYRNSTRGNGGAIAARDSDVEVTAAAFAGNLAGGNGGAIALQDSTLDAVASAFASNGALDNGGAIAAIGSRMEIDSCFFLNNRAGGNGGAIAQKDGAASVTNSTFDGNSAGGLGNAIYSDNSLLYLLGNTFGPNQDVVVV